MGLGDWLMATSQVKRLHEKSGRAVYVCRPDGRPVHSEVFENNPRISSKPIHQAQRLINAPGARPYIVSKSPLKWTWRKWDIQPGEMYFSRTELEFAEPYRGAIMIEPHAKVPTGNKSWIWDRWQAVVKAVPGRFIQVGPLGTKALYQVDMVPTTFRQAAAVLSVCRGFVGTEGALHHAAAAVGVPAVVLFSEFISPDITGYPNHRNLRHAGPACGARMQCKSCLQSMEDITVAEVVTNLESIL